VGRRERAARSLTREAPVVVQRMPTAPGGVPPGGSCLYTFRFTPKKKLL